MKTVFGSEVGGTSLPDMKTTYHRCCRSVLWTTLSVHLLTPPRERTLGTSSRLRSLRKKHQHSLLTLSVLKVVYLHRTL